MVQSYYLWSFYKLQEDLFKDRNGQREPKWLWLWHGTGNNHPKVIYDGPHKDGFNTQDANDSGLFGRAVCFAANASYSTGHPERHGYAHPLPDGTLLSDNTPLPEGTKMVILCKVQVGESQAFDRYQQDRRNPDAGFDSGKAVSDSTVLYFLWGGARKGAYPMFLVYFVGDELSKL
jgi:hypothetical protein